MISQLSNNKKLNQILQNFIDVLKIHIFIIDLKGRSILTPRTDYHGWDFIVQTSFKIDKGSKEIQNVLGYFTKAGEYLEYKDPFGLHLFAIPIMNEMQAPTAYVVVGPVMVNKRLDRSVYEELAQTYGVDTSQLLDTLDDVRIVSYNNLKSILELIADAAKYAISAAVERQKLKSKLRFAVFSDLMHKIDDLHFSSHLDEILSPLLDMALAMTQAECGSIMILDPKTNELTIKVVRSPRAKKLMNTTIKLGEGISGIAAQDNKSFILEEKHADNRIQALLKRPEIKCAIVLPITSANNRVLGVLNVHTEQAASPLSQNSAEIIKSLTKLTNAALQSVQI